jgi:hypothetical protein
MYPGKHAQTPTCNGTGEITKGLMVQFYEHKLNIGSKYKGKEQLVSQWESWIAKAASKT